MQSKNEFISEDWENLIKIFNGIVSDITQKQLLSEENENGMIKFYYQMEIRSIRTALNLIAIYGLNDNYLPSTLEKYGCKLGF